MRWVFQVQHETYSVLAVISFFAFNWLNIKLATWFLVYWTFAEMQIKKKKKHNQCNGCTRELQICFCLPIWKMWISWIFCIKKSKNIKYFFSDVYVFAYMDACLSCLLLCDWHLQFFIFFRFQFGCWQNTTGFKIRVCHVPFVPSCTNAKH